MMILKNHLFSTFPVCGHCWLLFMLASTYIEIGIDDIDINVCSNPNHNFISSRVKFVAKINQKFAKLIIYFEKY